VVQIETKAATSTSSSTGTTSSSSAVIAASLPPPIMEQCAKALHSLARHRGGGPFGTGRLKDEEEVLQLQDDLTAVATSLRELDCGAAGGAAAAASSKAKGAINNVGGRDSFQATAATTTVAVVANAKAIAEPISNSNSNSAPTVAAGLEEFLRDPRQLPLDRLESLKASLQQCLAMVSQEATTAAVALGEVGGGAGGGGDSTTDGTTSATTSEGVGDDVTLEKELPIAMGLLLKHRGGTGFGSGRLGGWSLTALEARLRSVISKLKKEAEAFF
jgi:hypothetical protein